MNEHFIPVKVDREERPDVDAIYMEAVQGMTGQGGWPLTTFLDPDGVPFHGGTYFPPEPRHGMPSFRMVMEAVREAWIARREEIRAAADRTGEQLGAIARIAPSTDPLGPYLVADAINGLRGQADRQNGGFGSAPKFPPAAAVDLLLAKGEREITERTLDAMASGGIYDQLRGGFARYSVDAVWLVPHFEKMLYDNALLARTYLHGYQELGHERYRRVCIETLDWALAEMRGPEGGFYSALDADSEGEEGRFYVWAYDEARSVLEGAGLEAAAQELLDWLGITPTGNFEGARSVVHLPAGAWSEPPADWEAARDALLAAREGRIRPGLDDKRLASWNALMIGAMAEAGAVLGEQRFVAAAVEAADFVLETMRDDNGRLLRTYKDGEAKLNAYLEDHAYLLEALLTLYEATFDPRHYDSAVAVAETMIERFGDEERGGFFTTSDDHEELIARRKDIDDHPIPSGNASAALGLLRLGALSGERRYEELSVGVLRLLHKAAERHPNGLAYLLRALDFHTSGAKEVALIAPQTSGLDGVAELAAVARARFRPNTVLAGGVEGSASPPLLADRPAVAGAAAAYVCERFTCEVPVQGAEELAELLT